MSSFGISEINPEYLEYLGSKRFDSRLRRILATRAFQDVELVCADSNTASTADEKEQRMIIASDHYRKLLSMSKLSEKERRNWMQCET